ncbi:hypothetical protein CTEN210_17000 [Chaetoceros tenuissimus]|uniref:Dynein regulatory complex protein 1/2 N-terminal domain-containing protein n=1 Tax=Chaetoceros tenuissimus TaxID=426638 RepID=A0AAD3DD90_9STRA|nr:hypothetical protein CTEN210_17000 [Chaetoceros tenuissimus]
MSTREERIQKRRELIQERCAKAVNNGEENNEVNLEDTVSIKNEEIPHHGIKQVNQSLSLMNLTKNTHVKEITNIQLKQEKAEHQLRKIYSKERQEVSRLAGEAKSMLHQDFVENFNISPNDDVKEVYSQLESIRNGCQSNLEAFSNVVNQLHAILRCQEQQYIDTVKQQENFVDTIRNLMCAQLSSLETLANDELLAIEEMYEVDRNSLIEKQKSQLDAMIRDKEEFEQQELQLVSTAAEERSLATLKVYDEVNKEYNALRDKLQNEVYELEREWSVSKGLYSVSADQIEYDNREVGTRNKESEQRIKKNKKRIVQIKEELKRCLEDARVSEDRDKKLNESMELDCRRLEKQFQNLMNKLHRFELLQEEKFKAASVMHAEEAATLTDRIERAWASTEAILFHSLPSSETIDNGNRSKLLKMLENYHNLLEKRSEVSHKLTKAENQNSQLERNLDKLYNDENIKSLLIPPSRH